LHWHTALVVKVQFVSVFCVAEMQTVQAVQAAVVPVPDKEYVLARHGVHAAVVPVPKRE